jgi:hypothetical protein
MSARVSLTAFSILGILFSSLPSKAQSDDPAFCSELARLRLIDQFGGNDRLFYRNASGAIKEVVDNQSVPKNINYFYYFVRSQPEQERTKGVINLKFVYFTSLKPNRKTLVGLSNDRWNYIQSERSKAACSNLSVEGYDNYHLYGTGNVCLTYHFHQSDPNTLETSDHRRSFAFGDMIPGQTSGFFRMFGPFISAARANEGADNSTIRGTLARSWIRNFVHQKSGSCVRIVPYVPQDAESLSLRVVNHSNNLQQYTWSVRFEK